MQALKACTHFFWMRIFLGIWLLIFFSESIQLMGQYQFLADLFDIVPARPFSLAVVIGFVASMTFIAGIGVRVSALTLFTALQIVLFAIPRFRIVAFPYISIMLLVTALFYRPSGRFGLRSSLDDRGVWYLPLFIGIYAGFSVSGISKLCFHLWNNGDMVRIQCTLSLLGKFVGSGFCEQMPARGAAFVVAILEVISLPLALFSRTRQWIWLMSTILHFAIIFFVPQLAARSGVFIMQLFLFDHSWKKEEFLPIALVAKLRSNYLIRRVKLG